MLGLKKRCLAEDCGFGLAAWNFERYDEGTEKMLALSLL